MTGNILRPFFVTIISLVNFLNLSHNADSSNSILTWGIAATTWGWSEPAYGKMVGFIATFPIDGLTATEYWEMGDAKRETRRPAKEPAERRSNRLFSPPQPMLRSFRRRPFCDRSSRAETAPQMLRTAHKTRIEIRNVVSLDWKWMDGMDGWWVLSQLSVEHAPKNDGHNEFISFFPSKSNETN